ncbi:MAG: hypothetical protein PHI19_06255 [Clostridia bacterium]|nr:hypothetical protein [Clostridia bacterium]
MDWLDTLIRGIADFMNTKLDFLSLGDYSPAIYIAVAGVIGVLLAFFIALIANSASKAKKFRNYLEDTKAYVNKLQVVDENNVDMLYDKIKSMPRPVTTGWSAFMSQQTGYPSDYITEKECLDERKSGIGFHAGRGFFRLASIIIICLCAALSAIACLDLIKTPGLTNATAVSITVLATVCAPVLFFAIFCAVLHAVSKKSYRKLSASFLGFQDALDSAVTIFREEQDEFVSENIEEINSAIEEILANKLNNTEVIELVTTPKLEEEDIPAEAPQDETPAEEPATQESAPKPAPAPAPAPVAAQEPAPIAQSEPVAAAQLSEDDRKGQLLVQLVYIVESAVSDPNSDTQSINELAELLYNHMISGNYDTPEEHEIFVICLNILAQYKK